MLRSGSLSATLKALLRTWTEVRSSIKSTYRVGSRRLAYTWSLVSDRIFLRAVLCSRDRFTGQPQAAFNDFEVASKIDPEDPDMSVHNAFHRHSANGNIWC